MALIPVSILLPHFHTDNGAPLAGGTLELYEAGTTTPTEFFTAAGVTLGTSEGLDARGEPVADLYLDSVGVYKFILKDASDVLIREWDNVAPPISANGTLEWLSPKSATFVDTDTFTIEGDPQNDAGESIYHADRRVRVYRETNDDYLYASIDSASYNGVTDETTVNLSGITDKDGAIATLSNEALTVWAGIIGNKVLPSAVPVTVGTYTDLRAFTTITRVVYVRGASADGDGGEGVFVPNAADMTSADDGGHIIIAGQNVRYVRQSSIVTAAHYGVVAGSGVNESTGLAAAISRASTLGLPYVDLAPGSYEASGLTLGTVRFRGDGAYFTDLAYRVIPSARPVRFKLPTGFSWAPVSEYWMDAFGRAAVDFDVEEYWLSQEVQGIVEYYVDWENGSDADVGSVNSPLKTINAAIQKADVGVVWLYPGVHYDGFDGTPPTRDIEFRSLGGKEVTIRMGEDPSTVSFSVTSGTAFEYEATIARQVFIVLDPTKPDGHGGYQRFTKLTSKTAVNAAPGSFFYDVAATKLYVRMFEDRAPGTDIILLTGSTNPLNGDVAAFFRGVRIEGGNNCIEATATGSGANIPRLYMQDCKLFYGINFGLDGNGAKIYLERTEAAHSGLDTLNYHVQDGTDCEVVEVDCIGRHAGEFEKGSIENRNGSSIHDNGNILRINGEYHDNYGPNVIDTNAGVSGNFGTLAYNSVAPTASINFSCGDSANNLACSMYVHGGRSKRSQIDFFANEGTLFVADTQDSNLTGVTAGNGIVRQYWPEPA